MQKLECTKRELARYDNILQQVLLPKMDCEVCQKEVALAMANNDTILNIIRTCKDQRVPVPQVTCRKCDDIKEKGAKAFIVSGNPMEVVVCLNRGGNPEDIATSLTHEMIHAYDYILNRCDFNTCKGLAFTEVRAAKYAECNGEKINWFRNNCIKRHAVNSTAVCFLFGGYAFII